MARDSIIINGSPTAEFSMTKGAGQRDPLSPFFFIIAMEGLNVALKYATYKGIFDGIHIPNTNVCLSHLLYADHVLFLGDWSHRNVANPARILRCFYVSSSLKVNFSNSKVYGIGVLSQEVVNWASPLGCEPAVLPFTYLSVSVGLNMNRKVSWNTIMDKLRSKLSTWKAKTFSIGKRITLAKTVLGSLPTFFVSIFGAPNGVIRSLEKIRR